MEATDGYLSFDRVAKSYATKNGKYIIRPPLSEALKNEELSDSELATATFVLKTGNATMFFLEELRVLRQPFDADMLEQLSVFCSRPFEVGDAIYEKQKCFLMALEMKLKKERQAQRDSRRVQARFQTLESAMAATGSHATAGARRNCIQQASRGRSTSEDGERDSRGHN